MSGIGPVEPVNSPDTDSSCEVIGTDSPRLTDWLNSRLHDRLTALSPRARKAVAAAAAISAAAAGALILFPRTSTPSEKPPPTPFPANVTTFRYTGLAATFNPRKPRPASGLFRFAVTVHSGSPVTLRVTGAAFKGLDARIAPDESFTVPPRHDRQDHSADIRDRLLGPATRRRHAIS